MITKKAKKGELFVEDLPLISRRLRSLRTAAGMTQQQLAVAAGLSISLVSQIEQGTNSDPRLSTAQSLAKALGVRLAELTEPDSKTNKPPAKEASSPRRKK